MALVRFHKVTVLPANLEADSFYLVRSGTYSETYITDSSGTALSLGNSAMIEAVANSLITNALADLNGVEVVATIAARDALSKDRNFMVLVQDASADTTVNSGSALYAYSTAQTAFVKVAEYESMDLVLQWDSIQGRPTSAPSQIDDAVTKRHTHANKVTLDKISDVGGELYYNGTAVSSGNADWATTNW